jgi:hypothetical protein
MDTISATYTKVGRLVTATAFIRTDAIDATGGSGAVRVSGLPFTPAGSGSVQVAGTLHRAINWGGDFPLHAFVVGGLAFVYFNYRTSVNGATIALDTADLATGVTADQNQIAFTVSYEA